MDSEEKSFWDSVFTFVVYIGAYQVFWWVWRFILIFKKQYLGVKATTERYGVDSWAVVTGASDGIGLAAARHLAKQGFNIVLIARDLTKLNKAAKDLQLLSQKVGKEIQTRVIVIDFTKVKDDTNFYENIYVRNLADIDISILINNVGTAQIG